jgi:exopolysaccharide biosynthesis polyprenyl glycosylphosphotransferase
MTEARTVQKKILWRVSLRERQTLLIVGDFIAAFLAMGLALVVWVMIDRFPRDPLVFLQRRPPQWFFLLPVFWVILLVELYDPHRASRRSETLKGILFAALAGLAVYSLFFFTSDPGSLPRRGVAIFLVSAALLTLGWRLIFIQIFTAPGFIRRILLVGGGETGKVMLREIQKIQPLPFSIVGIIDDDPAKQGREIEQVPVLGTSNDLLRVISEHHIAELIVAISGELQGCMFQALLDAQEQGVEITRMPVAFEDLLGRVPIRALEADWILRSFVDHARVTGFYELGKRLIDLAGGIVGAVAFLIVLPFVSIALLLDDGRPIFYSQTRAGKGGQLYQITKFRTMRRDAEADGSPRWAKEDDERATRVGRILRKTHLDELPQFITVLRGEMSLVGPRAERPELMQIFQQHVPFYRARLLVKPGITGWAQVNYGYASTIEETMVKLEYDLYYIKHRNLLLDLIILLRTPATVLGFRGR